MAAKRSKRSGSVSNKGRMARTVDFYRDNRLLGGDRGGPWRAGQQGHLADDFTGMKRGHQTIIALIGGRKPSLA